VHGISWQEHLRARLSPHAVVFIYCMWVTGIWRETVPMANRTRTGGTGAAAAIAFAAGVAVHQPRFVVHEAAECLTVAHGLARIVAFS
jgi:hypothetical protein